MRSIAEVMSRESVTPVATLSQGKHHRDHIHHLLTNEPKQFGFQTRSHTNHSVQTQKQARNL